MINVKILDLGSTINPNYGTFGLTADDLNEINSSVDAKNILITRLLSGVESVAHSPECTIIHGNILSKYYGGKHRMGTTLTWAFTFFDDWREIETEPEFKDVINKARIPE